MADPKPLRILLLVDSLPYAEDPDPLLRTRNVIVGQQMRFIAGNHQVSYPLMVPRLPSLVKGLYALRGLHLHFPCPRQGAFDGLRVKTLRYFFLPRLYTRMKLQALKKYLRLESPAFDLVHCHSVYDLGVVGLALKKELGLPLVVTVHGTDVNWLLEDSPLRADKTVAGATGTVLRGADSVIAVSRDLQQKVGLLGVNPEKIHWIPNGVDTGLFHPGPQAPERRKLGLPLDKKLVLYVGNFFETKGLGELVEAVSMMETRKDNLPQFEVILAGPDSPYKENLRRAVASRGLERQVRILGQVPHPQVPSLMRAADLFCLPSWREGWPCTVLEALACGRPSVSAAVGGLPELIDSDSLGLLCPPKDPAALADTLCEALTRKWDAEHIARAAEIYSFDRLVARIEAVYRGVLRDLR